VKIRPSHLAIALIFSFVSLAASAQTLRIPIPKRSHPTPVQKLNQAGVKDLNKNKVEAAQKEFFKAYLIDPNDPFTLNNLGYVAELQGEVEKAQKYYEMAAANATDALVDKSTSKAVEGKTLAQVAGHIDNSPLEVNRLNVQAIGLLQKDRAFEAESVLRRALEMDAHNPFTLNNMGFAQEKQGELEKALQFYKQAAMTNSREKIVVANEENRGWRGQPISEVAQKNAEKVTKLMKSEDSVEAKVARLNLRGVSALNHNDRTDAKKYFQDANKLDPNNAFSLNNMGYLAELEGDRETANFYYSKAQRADNSGTKVGVATRLDAEGKPLEKVADRNETVVDTAMQTDAAKKKATKGSPELKKRDGTTAIPAPPEKTTEEPK
jgi:Flp pilus assembly protein TadD